MPFTMTQITPVNFSQKWDRMISPETEQTHKTSAFYNHAAMIATVVSSIALTVFASVIFPEATTFLLIGIVFLVSPAVELSKSFLQNAQEAKKLEDQAQKVRNYYLSFVSQKETNPECKALALHWKQKACEAQESYKKLYEAALKKGTDSKVTFLDLQKTRWDAMEAEKTAAMMRVYSLFLESLIAKPLLFQKSFMRYGDNFSTALSDFSTWDSRDVEKRTSDFHFAVIDPLLKFHNTSIPSITYTEVFQDRWKEQIKNRLNKALVQKMAH